MNNFPHHLLIPLFSLALLTPFTTIPLYQQHHNHSYHQTTPNRRSRISQLCHVCGKGDVVSQSERQPNHNTSAIEDLS